MTSSSRIESTSPVTPMAVMALRCSFSSSAARGISLPLAIGVLICWASPAHADFSVVPLEDVIKRSEVIAVVRFAEPLSNEPSTRFDLRFDRVLKGDLKPGTHAVTVPSPLSAFPGEFVAFCGPGMRWEFTAWPISKDTGISDGILEVCSTEVNDFGGIGVRPDLLTLDRLMTLVERGTLSYKVRGPLTFPVLESGQPEIIVRELEVIYSLGVEDVKVNGLPEWKGSFSRNTTTISPRGVWLLFSSDRTRSLSIEGNQLTWDKKTDIFGCQFHITEPLLLTQGDFDTFLAEPGLGNSGPQFTLDCDRPVGHAMNKKLSLRAGNGPAGFGGLHGWTRSTLSADLVTYGGPFGVNRGWSGNQSPYGEQLLPNRKGTARMYFPLEANRYLVLEFDCGAEQKELPFLREAGVIERPLISAALSGGITGSIWTLEEFPRQEKTVAMRACRFVASLDGFLFTRPARPEAPLLLTGGIADLVKPKEPGIIPGEKDEIVGPGGDAEEWRRRMATTGRMRQSATGGSENGASETVPALVGLGVFSAASGTVIGLGLLTAWLVRRRGKATYR